MLSKVNKGFTMLETMIVLGITVSIMIIGSISLKNEHDNYTTQMFLKKFVTTYASYRTKLLSTSGVVRVSISRDNKTVTFKSHEVKSQTIDIPETVRPSADTINFPIRSDFGNSPRSLYFIDGKGDQWIVKIQMGWGQITYGKVQ